MSIINSLKNAVPKIDSAISTASLVTLAQSIHSSVDVFTTSLTLDLLASQKKVLFISNRENYGHFLAQSKKLGKSFEGYINTGSLKFVQALATDWTQDVVPIGETSPATYILSSKVHVARNNSEILNMVNQIEEKECVVIDSADYFVKQQYVLLEIYRRVLLKGGTLIVGMAQSPLKDEFLRVASVVISQENDVGGHGKLKIRLEKGKEWIEVLWKWTNSGFEIRNSIQL